MIFTLENNELRVGINQRGGCLASIVDKATGDELLYQPLPDSWQGQDVVIFPFIARLKGKTYTHKGKEYSLKNHGLARYYDFQLEEARDGYLSIVFQSDEATKQEYPFDFLLRVIYSVEGKKLNIRYEVENKSGEVLPFGIGAHPAFRIDVEKTEQEWLFEGNYICFDKPLSLTRMMFEPTGSFIIGEEPYGTVDRIELSQEIIRRYATLALKGEGLNNVTLLRKNGRKIRFNYPKIEYFILWSYLPFGDFVAIEPWMSLPDYDDCPKEIMEKKSLIHLEPGQTYYFDYSVSI